jgi:hypothetical protein
MGCPLSTPTLDESRPILAALTHLEQRDGLPVDGGQLAAFLSLREMWGLRWRQRLGRLLRQYEREGRLRRVAARPLARRPDWGYGVPAGWRIVATKEQAA